MTALDPIRDEVLRRANIAEHAQRAGFKRRSRAWFCGFHDDRTPSASIRKGRIRCFACGRSWDCIDLTMKTLGLDYVDALRELASEYCVPFPDQKLSPAERKRYARATELAPALGRAAWFWWKGRRAELEDLKREAIDGEHIDVDGLAEAGRELYRLDRLDAEGIVRAYLAAAKADPIGTAAIVETAAAWDAASTQMAETVLNKIAEKQGKPDVRES